MPRSNVKKKNTSSINIAKTYINNVTFAFGEAIEELILTKPEKIIELDGYAFDIDELLQLADKDIFTNMHTQKEFSENAKTAIAANPFLADKARNYAASQQSLTNTTVRKLADLTKVLLVHGDSREGELALNEFNDYYLSLQKAEKDKLDKFIIRDTINNTTFVFGKLYDELIKGRHCVKAARQWFMFLVKQQQPEMAKEFDAILKALPSNNFPRPTSQFNFNVAQSSATSAEKRFSTVSSLKSANAQLSLSNTTISMISELTKAFKDHGDNAESILARSVFNDYYVTLEKEEKEQLDKYAVIVEAAQIAIVRFGSIYKSLDMHGIKRVTPLFIMLTNQLAEQYPQVLVDIPSQTTFTPTTSNNSGSTTSTTTDTGSYQSMVQSATDQSNAEVVKISNNSTTMFAVNSNTTTNTADESGNKIVSLPKGETHKRTFFESNSSTDGSSPKEEGQIDTLPEELNAERMTKQQKR